jgi:curved DNA-binding protein CbpA
VATHYEVLAVAPGASHEEVQRAYRQLARDHHPDTKAGASRAASEHARDIMAAVNSAWTVLGDPARRRAYDHELGARSPAQADPVEPEPEEHEAWWDLDAEPTAPGGLGELVVLIPVALFALSVAAFAFSLMSQSGSVMALALVLLPIAGVTFMAMPLVAMMRRARSRTR